MSDSKKTSAAATPASEVKDVEDIRIMKIFDGAFGRLEKQGVDLALAELDDRARVSLGEQAGKMSVLNSIDDSASIHLWLEQVHPRLFNHIVIEPRAAESLLDQQKRKEKADEEEAKRKAGEPWYQQHVVPWLRGCKAKLGELFSLGIQAHHRKDKCFRYRGARITHAIRKAWTRMLNLAKNGPFVAAPVFKEDQRLEESRERLRILDFDISPAMQDVAILYRNDSVYIYSVKLSSTALEYDTSGVEWTRILHDSSQTQACKVRFIRYAEHELAVCGKRGITMWRGKKRTREGTNKFFIDWKVVRTIAGEYTTMDSTSDGRLLALGSCYSATIDIYDLEEDRVTSVPKLDSVVREVAWSPQDHYLLATGPAAEFRVFESGKGYTNERWSNFAHPINSLICTNDETRVFASVENSSLVYSILKPSPDASFALSSLVMDFGFHSYRFSNDKSNREWSIAKMVMSPLNRRLAVMYTPRVAAGTKESDKDPLRARHRAIICLFAVKQDEGKNPRFVPLGFVQNHEFVSPVNLRFFCDHEDRGQDKEFLAIQWENMKLSFLYCVD